MEMLGIDKVAEEARHIARRLDTELMHNRLGDLVVNLTGGEAQLADLTPEERLIAAADALAPLPVKGDVPPRWTLVENRAALQKDAARYVFGLADEFELRRPVNSPVSDDVLHLDPAQVSTYVESGANRTGTVRRTLAAYTLRAQAALAALGQPAGADDDLTPLYSTIWQFGGGRVIAPTRADGSDNPEYKNVHAIADPYLPEGETTEFEVNAASALKDGWVEDADRTAEISERFRHLGLGKAIAFEAPARPRLVVVQPLKSDGMPGGTLDGITAMGRYQQATKNRGHGHMMLASNGQYREKLKLQAAIGCLESGQEPLGIHVIGDETGARGEGVYTLELGAIARLIPQLHGALQRHGREGILQA